jgi:hypothetical protein
LIPTRVEKNESGSSCSSVNPPSSRSSSNGGGNRSSSCASGDIINTTNIINGAKEFVIPIQILQKHDNDEDEE